MHSHKVEHLYSENYMFTQYKYKSIKYDLFFKIWSLLFFKGIFKQQEMKQDGSYLDNYEQKTSHFHLKYLNNWGILGKALAWGIRIPDS